jgi:hypothetical protein
MAEGFAEAIASWQPFYNLAGSAAFTLLGLIFVAVSINISIIALAKEQGDLVQFARQTLGNFLTLVIVALIFMIPGQSPRGTGMPLFIVGILMMWRSAKLWKFQFVSKGQRFLDTALFRSNLLIPNTVSYAVLIFISVQLFYGNVYYLSWMTLVVIWLLIAGSLNAWFLMLRLAKIEEESKEKR